MTDQEINTEIAKLCGWVVIYRPEIYEHPFFDPDGVGCSEIPGYCSDLNACREMESFIPSGKHGFYNAELAKVVCNRTLSAVVKEPEFIFMLIRASERQRCEAFLRVHGKWKD